MYQRQIQVYKGIDNIIEFKLMNRDQKPINTSLYTPVFVAFDENKNQVLKKECTVLDDGSSPTRGLFQVTITEGELLNLDQQFINYNVYLIDENDNRILTYTDSHFGNNGIIYLSSEAFPAVKPSSQITQFTAVNGTYFSEIAKLDPEENNNIALHTAAIYSTNYTGTITVQATLENQITGTTNWANVASLSVSNANQPSPINFSGVYKFVRFKSDTDPSTISKILVRN